MTGIDPLRVAATLTCWTTRKIAGAEMPDSIVSRFVILESANLTESRLRLRFIPEKFDANHTDPVVRIEVDLAADLEMAEQKISQIKMGLVDDITVDDSSLSVYLEHIDAPIQFLGQVTRKYEDYATSDYIAEIKNGALTQDWQGNEIARLGQTIDRAVRFIDRTIDRIEKKQELTGSKNSDLEEQIQLLRGARRHLAEDEPAG